MYDVKENWCNLKIKDDLINCFTSFEDILPLMKKVTDDGLIHKHVLRHGLQAPGKVRADSVVSLHYTVELEQDGLLVDDEDGRLVDSTIHREEPLKVDIQGGSLFHGIEIGVLTMTKKEVAVFIISPEYAYGVKGIPPRIPPRSRVLVTLEVLDFFKHGSANNILARSEEENRTNKFKKIRKVAIKEMKKGNRFWKMKEWFAASQCFDQGIKLLSQYKLKDEYEELRQQHLLLKLFLNQAACGLVLKQAQLVCICCREALEIQKSCPKALYRFGRAKLMLEDADTAIRLFSAALGLKPRNRSIIKRLEEAIKEKHHGEGVRGYREPLEMSEFDYMDDEPGEGGEDDEGVEDDLDLTLEDLEDAADTTLEDIDEADNLDLFDKVQPALFNFSNHQEGKNLSSEVKKGRDQPSRLKDAARIEISNSMSLSEHSSSSGGYAMSSEETPISTDIGDCFFSAESDHNNSCSERILASNNNQFKDLCDDISEVSEDVSVISLVLPRKYVDLEIQGRRFVYERDQQDCGFIDLTLDDIQQDSQGGLDGFRGYLRQLLQGFKGSQSALQNDTDTRVPIQVCAITSTLLAELTQELNIRLRVRKIQGRGLSFIIN